MNPRVFVALLTVVVFAAGYLARLLTEPAPSVPPAPAALAREFAPPAGSGERRQRRYGRKAQRNRAGRAAGRYDRDPDRCRMSFRRFRALRRICLIPLILIGVSRMA